MTECLVGSTFFPESFAQIFITGIGKNSGEYRTFTFFQTCGNSQTASNSSSSRNSNEQSFFPREPDRELVSIFSRNSQILIRNRGVVNLGYYCALHVLSAFDAVEWRIRLQGNTFDGRIQLFQPPRRANEGSAGSHHGHKVRNPAVALLPDFIRRAVIMCLPVSIVRILIGVEVLLRMLSIEFSHFANRPVRSFARVSENNFRAVSMQNTLTLNRNILRHAKGDGESFRRSDQIG